MAGQHGVDAGGEIDGVFTASFLPTPIYSNNQIASFYPAPWLTRRTFPSITWKNDAELVVISPNDPTAMCKYAGECRELGIPYLYDPGQQVVRSTPDEIREGILGAQSLFINDYEYELIQKHTRMSADEIIDAVDFVVITLGEKGSDIRVKDQHYPIPPIHPACIADPPVWGTRSARIPAREASGAGLADLWANGLAGRHLLPGESRHPESFVYNTGIHQAVSHFI